MRLVDDKGDFMLSTLSTLSTNDTTNAAKTLETLETMPDNFEVVPEPTDTTDTTDKIINVVNAHVSPDGRKIPPGSKQCKSCGHIVKGPRTLVCPACNAEFGKRKPNGPARSKMVAKTTVGQVRTILKKGNDPWAIENRTELYDHDKLDKRNNVKQLVTALIPRETSTIRAMEYAKTVVLPKSVRFPNNVIAM